MTRDETIALFNKCEAARRQAFDAGADEAKAHKAAGNLECLVCCSSPSGRHWRRRESGGIAD
ncbi:MAG: hypothetical protein R3D02_13550 [Hyphomicrobiales bacterium]